MPATQPKQRPVYESKTIPSQAMPRERQQRGGHFNLPETLRQIEQQFAHLRNDLQAAEHKLRQRDDDLRRARRTERPQATVIAGEPSPEELARLNVQLEARNTELQARIDDLLADSEDRAASAGAGTEAPVADPEQQMRSLLVLKLQEDYEDFLALESEAPDIVVQQHFRSLLRHVFEVLKTEGVAFKEPPPAA